MTLAGSCRQSELCILPVLHMQHWGTQPLMSTNNKSPCMGSMQITEARPNTYAPVQLMRREEMHKKRCGTQRARACVCEAACMMPS